MDPENENAVEPEVDYEAELIGELMDFFLTLFHNVVYHRSGLKKEHFRFLEMYGLSFPFCVKQQIDTYIQFCVKKVTTLLLSGSLEGFQIEFHDRGQAVQRYIGMIDGKFVMDLGSGTTTADEYKMLIAGIRDEARRLLLTYNELALEIPKTGGGTSNKPDMHLTRIKISLGVLGEAVQNYNLAMDGKNDGTSSAAVADNDSDIFPWSKPKAKITCRDVGSQFTKATTHELDQKFETPTKGVRSGEERQTKKADNLFFVKSPGSFGTVPFKSPDISASPLREFFQSPRSPSPGRAAITPTTRAVAELKAPAMFPIETIEFGPVTLCFYVLTYYRNPPQPSSRLLKVLAQSKSELTLEERNNLSSPGLPTKSPKQGRENEDYASRTPPGSGLAIGNKFGARTRDSFRSNGSPYNVSPLARTHKSPRSLVSSFEKTQIGSSSQSSPSPSSTSTSNTPVATSWAEYRARMKNSSPK